MSEIKFKDKALWVLEEPIALQPEETQTIILPTTIKTAAKALTLTQEILKNGASEYQFNVKSSINCIIEYKNKNLKNETFMIMFNRDIEDDNGYFTNTTMLNLQGNDIEKITLEITNNHTSELLEISSISIFESDDVQVTTIAKVIKEDTIVADMIHSTSIITDKLCVEALETGIRDRDARYAKEDDEVHWIKISGNKEEYGVDILGSEQEQFTRTVTIAGVDYTYSYFYTAIEGEDAYKYLTTRDPLESHPDMPDSEREKFKFMLLKPKESYVKKAVYFALDELGNYTPTDVYGSGLGDGTKGQGFVYKNSNGFYRVYHQSDGKTNGIVQDDNGVHINGWADQHCESILHVNNGVEYKFAGEEKHQAEYVVDENGKIIGMITDQNYLTTYGYEDRTL